MFTPFCNGSDRFDITKVAGHVKASNEQHTIELNEPGDNYITVYGAAAIDNGRFEWGVRVDKCGDRQAIIGVATGSALAMIAGKYSDEPTGYGFGVNGLFRTGGQLISGNSADLSLHEGDVLFIRLDLKLKILSFAKNGILLDIKIPRLSAGIYRLALALVDEDEQYTLVNTTDYLARFSLLQYRISQLPLQDRFAYTGTRNQLAVTMHATCVTHAPPVKQVINRKTMKKLTVVDEGVDTAYGHRWISNKAFEWVLQIAGEATDYITIGVWGQAGNNEVDLKAGPFSSEFDKTRHGYGLQGSGRKVRNTIPTTTGSAVASKLRSPRLVASSSNRSREGGRGVSPKLGSDRGASPVSRDDMKEDMPGTDGVSTAFCSGFSKHDIIGVRLDLVSRTLSFTRNGNDLGVAFTDMQVGKDFGYRLAVKMRKNKCKLWLLAAHPLSTETTVQIEEFKAMGTDISAKRATSPEPEFDPSMPIATKQIFTYINQLKGGLTSSAQSIDNICDRIKKIQKFRKQQSAVASQRMGAGMLDANTPINVDAGLSAELLSYAHLLSLPQLFRAKATVTEVFEAGKQFHDSLDAWMNIINPTIAGHFKDWNEWSSDDIADWIIGLEDGRFSTYETVLRRELKTAKVVGKHLPMLTQNITYLQRFGIVEFDEELALQGHIQDLVNGKLRSHQFQSGKRSSFKAGSGVRRIPLTSEHSAPSSRGNSAGAPHSRLTGSRPEGHRT